MKQFRFLLAPFALLYLWITSVRNWLFDSGILVSKKFSLPVIVVGNLSVGGTGKTPQIEYLIGLLTKKYAIAVLSRGYKRTTTGFLKVTKNHTASDVGDEPLQFATKYDSIIVAVDEDRVHGISQLLQESTPEVVLLDDAFQHRKVQGSFSVLLSSYDDLFVNDFLLPMGNLRESRRGAYRANAVIVSKCPDKLSIKTQQKMMMSIRKYTKAPVFFTSITYSKTLKGNIHKPLKDLKDYNIVLITGIATPKPLVDFLTQGDIKFTHLQFPDHHNFTENDIRSIKTMYQHIQTDKKCILTTEKDYMRLSKKIKEISYIEIKTTFLENSAAMFDSLIKNHLNTFN